MISVVVNASAPGWRCWGGIRQGVAWGFVLSNLCFMLPSSPSSGWRLTDCPRDALQGWKAAVPTADKVGYLSALMQVGFDVLDAGSFVSPKAIPQMADTADVLEALPVTSTRVLAIVANLRGAQDALAHGRPDILGFPFSISETFQRRNAGTGMDEAWTRLDTIRNAVERAGKELVVYVSMGFGNPYGDAWSAERVADWSRRLHREMGVKHLALSNRGRRRRQWCRRCLRKLWGHCPIVTSGPICMAGQIRRRC